MIMTQLEQGHRENLVDYFKLIINLVRNNQRQRQNRCQHDYNPRDERSSQF